MEISSNYEQSPTKKSSILKQFSFKSGISYREAFIQNNSKEASQEGISLPNYFELDVPQNNDTKSPVIGSETPSDIQLFFVTVKLFFGISYLSMPNTFAQCGLIGGMMLFTLVITINGITMLQILKVADNYRNVLSYSDLGERVFGPRGRVLVDICILVKQLGVCITYLYFVSTQLDFIICQYTGKCMGSRLYTLVLILPVIIMSQVGSYKFLGSLSIPSIFIAITGMLCIFYYTFQQITVGGIDTADSELKYFDFEKMLGRIGLAMYIFDGNAIVVNIRAEANEKRVYYPRILVKAIVFSLVLFTFFATICYCVYRGNTQPIFTMNLVPINGIVVVILACICINALTSYPIQILAAFSILERFTHVSSESHGSIDTLKRVSLRSSVIIMTTLVCMVVKTFTDFINIAGALGSVTVAFILPQLFYWHAYGSTMSSVQKAGSIIIGVFGVVGSSYSIYYSVLKLSRGDLS